MTKSPSAFFTTLTNLVEEAETEASTKPIRSVEDEIRSLAETMISLSKEAEGSDGKFSVSNITSITGGDGEKAQKLVEMNSRLTGYRNWRTKKITLDRQLESASAAGFMDQILDSDPEQDVVVNQADSTPSIFSQIQMALGGDVGALVGTTNEIRVNPAGGTWEHEILNALFATGNSPRPGASWTGDFVRRDGVALSAVRTPRGLDLIPFVDNPQSAYIFMQENQVVNMATATAEGSKLPESTLRAQEVILKMQRVGHILPVSEQILRNDIQAERYLNVRMPRLATLALEQQAFLGDGTSAELTGIASQVPAGNVLTQTVTSGAATKPINTVMKAMTAIMATGEANASGMIVHPFLWEDIVLSESASGGYYIGSPFVSPVSQLWGIPVVVSTMMNTAAAGPAALVGDFAMHSELALDPTQMTVQVGMIDDDYAKDQLTLKARVWAAMAVLRASAFARINPSAALTR